MLANFSKVYWNDCKTFEKLHMKKLYGFKYQQMYRMFPFSSGGEVGREESKAMGKLREKGAQGFA